jgi:hypothetical protein
MPGPLVETGSVEARVCAVATPFDEVFGDGEGEGETVGGGEGAGVAEGIGDGSTVTEVCVAAEVVGVRLLRP